VPLGGYEQLHANGPVLSMHPRMPVHGMATEARWLARVPGCSGARMDHVDCATEFDFLRAAGIRVVTGRAVDRRSQRPQRWKRLARRSMQQMTVP